MILSPSCLILAPIGCLALLAGCATQKPFVWAERAAPTSIADGDGVVVILNTLRHCDQAKQKDCEQPDESALSETEFEYCMDSAMRKRLPNMKVVRAKEFRSAAFPGKGFVDAPRATEATLEALADPELQRRIERLNLRYMVVLDVKTTNSGADTKVEFGKGASDGMWGVTRQWKRSSWLTATVLDLRFARRAGTLNSGVSGEAGWVFPVFLIISLPPVPYKAATESPACEAMGLAAADFMGGKN
jgi:hypothetical protein